MPGETTQKTKKQKSPLIGSQAQPVVLDQTTKLDIDTKKKLADNIIDAGISGGLNISAIEDFTSLSNSRDQIYQLIDTMAQDSAVSAVVRTYAEDACEAADSGHIIWCESDDPKISKFINYLLNVMNADKNIFSWAYCLIKYGDVYLRLFRESDYADPFFKKSNTRDVLNESIKNQSGATEALEEQVNLSIHPASDHYSYYVEMVADPGEMFELTKFGQTMGYISVPAAENNVDFLQGFIVGQNQNQPVANYRMRTNDVNIYQADDFVHACLEDNNNRYPEKVSIFNGDDLTDTSAISASYSVRRGKSMLADSYKVWREKSLLEDSALLNRVTKSSIVRNIQVEVGDMSKEQVKKTLRSVKELFDQKSAVKANGSMAEYPNPGPIENNIFTAVHDGKGAITVSAVGGDFDPKQLTDLDWWNKKFYAAYGIPPAFFGFTDDAAGFNGGSSLAILSSIYSKGVKRVQNALIQAVTDIINLFLLDRGCKAYLNNFVIKMKTPLTQEEKDYREDLTNRITAISNFQGLLTDVEDKVRRLEILKELISTLNYGEGIIQNIDEEIEAVKLAKKTEEEQAKKEAEAATNEGSTETTTTETETAKEPDATEGSEDDLDLGLSSVAPTEEQFKAAEGLTPLVEGPDFDLDEDLPNPDSLNKDFTQNI